MSTPRIPPVPPGKGGELEKTASTEHRKVEKVEKISKIDEVDNESRARQKFRQFVDNKQEKPSNLPSPFSIFSSNEEITSKSVSSPSPHAPTAQNALPNPSYSPSPSTYLGGTAAQDKVAPSPLPQSQQFYGNVDTSASSNEQQSQTQMDETSRSSSRTFLTQNEQGKKTSDDEASRGKTKSKGVYFGEGEAMQQGALGHSGAFEIEAEGGLPLSGKKTEIPPEAFAAQIGMEESFPFPEGAKRFPGMPEGVIAPKSEKGVKYVGPLPPQEPMRAGYTGPIAPEETLGSQGQRGWREEEQKSIPTAERQKQKEWIANQDTAFGEPLQKEEREEGRGKKKSQLEAMQALQITSPTLTPLPEFVIPMASAATAAAAPYLGMEALAVYFHMIGTITAMVSPKGDSLTEFVLNAPSFSESKFYGATIAIERFATAPYQLNIRLTGSNAAVALFEKNIPNFLQAFQSKNFAFTINRIEAVYEKPLFRRKESVGEKEEKEKGFGGGSDMDQGKGR